MTREDVRTAVEAAIRRHLEVRRPAPPADGSQPVASLRAGDPAHDRYLRAVLAGDPPEGRCVIEPAVECSGCGYCQSQGH